MGNFEVSEYFIPAFCISIMQKIKLPRQNIKSRW